VVAVFAPHRYKHKIRGGRCSGAHVRRCVVRAAASKQVQCQQPIVYVVGCVAPLRVVVFGASVLVRRNDILCPARFPGGATTVYMFQYGAVHMFAQLSSLALTRV